MFQHDVLLFHFTSDRHINGCKADGLNRGVTFAGRTCTGLHFLNHTQWLTANPDFDQSWSQGKTLPYDRTANRLTICIPQTATKNLVPWTTFGPLAVPATFQSLSSMGDPENWYIYLGDVPPEWIVENTKKNSIQEKTHGTQKQPQSRFTQSGSRAVLL